MFFAHYVIGVASHHGLKAKENPMNAQINIVTLGVRDIDVSKKFYSQGLGCKIDQDHGGFVSFILGDGSAGLARYTGTRWRMTPECRWRAVGSLASR